ncbi:hypothetical protein L195_g034971, partial [Trifolium pratense]
MRHSMLLQSAIPVYYAKIGSNNIVEIDVPRVASCLSEVSVCQRLRRRWTISSVSTLEMHIV